MWGCPLGSQKHCLGLEEGFLGVAKPPSQPQAPACPRGSLLSQIHFLLAPKWQAALELIWEKLRD